MTPLAAALAQRIQSSGPITVEAYMAACLGDPAHGYYRGGDRLGQAGDFTTAPEISQIFGELIGLWAAETWRLLGAPRPVALVELGPGRGTLMADALRAIGRAMPEFRAALALHLVEISPGLRAAQQAALADAAPTWHDDLAALPDGPAIVVANEFFDALPIRQLERAGRAWHERMVTLAGDALQLARGPAVVDPPLEPAHHVAPEGAIVEIAPAARAAVAQLAARIARHGGAALIVDYGPAASAPGDSLQALRRHAPVPVLADPGLADLTAHVDFAALARVATESGAVAYGPITQAAFLARLGLAQRLAVLLRSAGGSQARSVASGAQRLIDPADMGTLFKVLAIGPCGRMAPPGFELSGGS
jgi:NADH dehydrogenase [ubiquinone] 1 alpha subcomplex assembly factor 7